VLILVLEIASQACQRQEIAHFVREPVVSDDFGVTLAEKLLTVAVDDDSSHSGQLEVGD
jgi:hypothetical protein